MTPLEPCNQEQWAILNTDTGILEFLTGDWLTEFSRACETIVEPLAALYIATVMYRLSEAVYFHMNIQQSNI